MEYISNTPPVQPCDYAPTVRIPADHVCIPRSVYDDLQARLNSLKNDFHDELQEQAEVIRRLNRAIDEKVEQIAEMQDDLDDARKRLADCSVKLYRAEEANISLRQEVAMLNDELARTDNIEEWKNATTERTEKSI